MTEQGSTPSQVSEPVARALYASPKLVTYGSLAALTRAVGNTSNLDGGGAPRVMKSQP